MSQLHVYISLGSRCVFRERGHVSDEIVQRIRVGECTVVMLRACAGFFRCPCRPAPRPHTFDLARRTRCVCTATGPGERDGQRKSISPPPHRNTSTPTLAVSTLMDTALTVQRSSTAISPRGHQRSASALPRTHTGPWSHERAASDRHIPAYAGPPPPSGTTQSIFCEGHLMSHVLQWMQFCALI